MTLHCVDRQVMGTKIVIMARVLDCMRFFETKSLQIARDRLQSLTASQLPDEMSYLTHS